MTHQVLDDLATPLPVPWATQRILTNTTFEELVTPALMRNYLDSIGMGPTGPVPRGIVMVYHPFLLDIVEADGPATRITAGSVPATIVVPEATEGRVGVAGAFGIGAPAATTVLEDLIALGSEAFVSIGAAGGLADDLTPGDLVLCDRAIRDEGTSHHYLPPAHMADADPELTGAMGAALAGAGLAHRRGSTWTTDALYRETIEEIHRFRDEGIDCVEMEAAALFAAGTYRGIPVSSVLCVSDRHVGDRWEGHFIDAAFADNVIGAVRTALAFLDEFVQSSI